MASEPATRQFGSGHAGPQPATDTLFEEHRGFTRSFVGLGLCMALGLAWGYAEH